MAPMGTVWAHVGQRFGETEYDVAIVGAGLLGAACALFLRETAPGLRVLLLEEAGLPNEEGATLLGAGLWDGAGALAGPFRQRASFTRERLSGLLGERLRPLPVLALGGEGDVDTATALADFPTVAGWVDPALLPRTTVREGLAYRPGEAALACAQAAIAAGADLMLNVRASFGLSGGGGAALRLARLTVTREHRVVTHEVCALRARAVLVAAGAAGPELLEAAGGPPSGHRRVWMQFPPVGAASAPVPPALRHGEWLLMPSAAGYTVYPPPPGPDPHGYAPTPGRLGGVQVGLRRELLTALVDTMNALPVLASERLNPGKSEHDLPGAAWALPGGVHGETVWEREGDAFLLLPGRDVDTVGLAVAHECAAALAAALSENTPG